VGRRVQAAGPSSGAPQDERGEQRRNERVAGRHRRGDGQRGTDWDEDRGRRDARACRGISDRKVGLHFDEIASHDGGMDGAEATLELRDVEPTGGCMRREPICDGIALGVTDAEIERRGQRREGADGGHGGGRNRVEAHRKLRHKTIRYQGLATVTRAVGEAKDRRRDPVGELCPTAFGL
jgi:hypothetical protein